MRGPWPWWRQIAQLAPLFQHSHTCDENYDDSFQDNSVNTRRVAQRGAPQVSGV